MHLHTHMLAFTMIFSFDKGNEYFRSASQHRLVEQRANLPPIVQINSPLLRGKTKYSVTIVILLYRFNWCE
jgi:hypothetical protein